MIEKFYLIIYKNGKQMALDEITKLRQFIQQVIIARIKESVITAINIEDRRGTI